MRCEILGIAFDTLTLPQAVDRARVFLAGDAPRTVATPNAEIVQQARKNPAAREAINAADLVLPDGIGVIRAARILGLPIRERVAGIDFAQALLPVLAETGALVYFLGASPGVAEEAARRAAEAHPGLRVCGVRDGYFADGSQPDVADAIRAAGAHAVFVCLGAPKQELFMRQYAARTGARLLVGLGGTFDVWAGRLKRAPQLFIRLNLEWLYRTLRQPKRLFRTLRLPAFLWAARRAKNKTNGSREAL
ncbi:MAG: WecB/TagA/CpsF family glycosyltransferase [Oscillospiraceae bacterium]|nr:WecB/TagA/CpsF family glycosyltransferase [Oscillospiraceae bacterium]